MFNTDSYYAQKGASLHGLSKRYARLESFPFHILVCEILSFTQYMEQLYGEDVGKKFTWDTYLAYVSSAKTLGEVLVPVQSYLEESSGVELPNSLTEKVLSTPFPEEISTVKYIHTPYSVKDLEEEFRYYYQQIEPDFDTENASSEEMIQSLYYGDYFAFQHWFTVACEKISASQESFLPEGGALCDVGRVLYDIIYDTRNEMFKGLEILQHDTTLAQVSKTWLRRMMWVAGKDNAYDALTHIVEQREKNLR